MSFTLKHNGQKVSLRWIKDAINCLGITRFVELNEWAEEYAWATDTPKAEEDKRMIQTAKPQRLPEDDLYEPLRNMFKYRKVKRRWY